jgi:hypothetical protein
MQQIAVSGMHFDEVEAEPNCPHGCLRERRNDAVEVDLVGGPWRMPPLGKGQSGGRNRFPRSASLGSARPPSQGT